MDFLSNNLHEILTFLAGVITGVVGSLITIKVQKSNSAQNGSNVVDQSGARAGRDIVGGNNASKN